MSLKDRLARLERRRPPGEMVVIVITGGFVDNPETAFAGSGRTWQRGPGEERPAFIARVRAEASAGGESRVIIGGFSDS